MAQGRLFVHTELCAKTHPSWHGLCLSCMVLIASVAILNFDIFSETVTLRSTGLEIRGMPYNHNQFRNVFMWPRSLSLHSTFERRERNAEII